MSASAAPAAPEKEQRGRARQGSSLSDKQIGKAAAFGRKVTFRFLKTDTSHEVNGYVVGMDDFHWMIATVIPFTERVEGQDPITLTLLHKSRVDMIVLHPQPSIDTEDAPVQESLRGVGQAFWRFCESNFNGR